MIIYSIFLFWQNVFTQRSKQGKTEKGDTEQWGVQTATGTESKENRGRTTSETNGKILPHSKWGKAGIHYIHQPRNCDFVYTITSFNCMLLVNWQWKAWGIFNFNHVGTDETQLICKSSYSIQLKVVYHSDNMSSFLANLYLLKAQLTLLFTYQENCYLFYDIHSLQRPDKNVHKTKLDKNNIKSLLWN